MTTYAKKAQAQTAAKLQYGDDWQTLAIVQKDDDGQWQIATLAPVEAEVEEKTNYSLSDALAESGETLDDLVDDAPVAPVAHRNIGTKATWRLSTTPKPTKKVWVIADNMPGASRKEVILACEAAGIAPGTSRTQYQAWFSATKASAK